jgi:MutS domain V/MutS domain I
MWSVIMSVLLITRRSWSKSSHLAYVNLKASYKSQNQCKALRVTNHDDLYQEILEVNNGQSLNVKSPRQVSEAIFGDKSRSVSRRSLMEAIASRSLDPQKQALAKLVLQYRQVHSGKLDQDELFESSHTNSDYIFKDIKGSGSIRSPNESSLETLDNVLPTKETLSNRKEKRKSKSPQSKAFSTSDDSYEDRINKLFEGKSKLHPYWRDHLLRMTKPSARTIVTQLNAEICPMGYDPLAILNDPLRVTDSTVTTAGKRGSLLAFVRDEKLLNPECILIVRVGDFYESFGVDALMLIEHCGLNPMAGKSRAGCPVRNIQATLDCLTKEDFKVAVYEEATDTNSSPGPAVKARLKNRYLGQIVSSASPSYLHDLVLLGNVDTLSSLPESRPYVGVIANAAGFTLVEVSMEDRSVKVSERLTPEAVACRFSAFPPVDPLLYIGEGDTRSLPFLSSSLSSRLRVKQIPAALVEAPSLAYSDVERVKRIVLRALKRSLEDVIANKIDETDFTLITTTAPSAPVTQTNPLYLETATQLGLMGDKTIPPLVASLLPVSAPAACQRFLRRWLLSPPPSLVSECMSQIVSSLRQCNQALPSLPVLPLGKVVALLHAGQASAHVYGEILTVLDATVEVMNTCEWFYPLMTILEFETGIAANPESLKNRCLDAASVIENIISPFHHVKRKDLDHTDQISDFGALIPRLFFERNEVDWRCRVRPEICEEAYHRVDEAARSLVAVVASDFWGLPKSDISQLIQNAQGTKSPVMLDIFNNHIAIKEVPLDSDPQDYFHPKDRNGKVIRNRFTTSKVEEALSEYILATENACREVLSTLVTLSDQICRGGHLSVIVQSSHFSLILSTAAYHAAKSKSLGWAMAKVLPGGSDEPDVAGRFCNVWPYWMDRSVAVLNSFELDGMFLLTAPNMSGKSTVMRTTATAALLSACGFCAPLDDSSVIRRFDNIFVRGASSDVPIENLSAFGAEVLDISALLRCCTSRSLVFVDELGRGTSPNDGTSIAAAVMEAMAQEGMSGIFATHLHGILDLPLRSASRIRYKRMTLISDDIIGEVSTFRLEDGVCTDSLALVTARRLGLPKSVIDRALTFSTILSEKASSDAINEESIPAYHGFKKKMLSDVMQVVALIQNEGINPVFIPPTWRSPPSLEGGSCVYILELQDNCSRFYVGETDTLSQRLQQHRSKGSMWSNAAAVVYPMKGGKSQARHMESLIIRKLASEGFDLISVSDGRTISRNTGP